MTTPTSEPTALTAGDTAKWLKALPEYPAADGWVLGYVLVNAAGRITFNATASGADHLVNVPASTTASWAAGSYQYQAAVSKSGERYTVGTGQIVVLANFAAGSGGLDARTHARRTLDAIEAVIEGRATQAQQEYTIADRQLKFISHAELLAMRDRYRAEVNAEEIAARIEAGLGARNKILVRL